ncbi:hypothetical protein LJR231_006045 [Phyllobacterium sp. LjRoot231]|uniref:hypothetical protein n=1 Tax=Phyllobacterium sp. LjRoot231 TaxID=3342289 RepID=UPI003ED1746A
MISENRGFRSVVVRVEDDNGLGLDSIASERIFEAFYQAGGDRHGPSDLPGLSYEAHAGLCRLDRWGLEDGSEFAMPNARGANEP